MDVTFRISAGAKKYKNIKNWSTSLLVFHLLKTLPSKLEVIIIAFIKIGFYYLWSMFFFSHIYSGKLENAYKAYFPTKNIISRASQNGVCISAMIEYDKMLISLKMF